MESGGFFVWGECEVDGKVRQEDDEAFWEWYWQERYIVRGGNAWCRKNRLEMQFISGMNCMVERNYA